MDRPKVVVIGGGMAGLCLAYRLTQKNFPVVIYEKADFWGGADSSIAWHDLAIEKHYHHYFSHDSEILSIIEELGLKDRLAWKESSTGLYQDGKIYDLAPLKFLMGFSPLSLFERLQFLYKMFRIISSPKLNKEHPFLKNESAASWAQKYFGKKTADLIWIPLLRSKFGSSYESIASEFLYGRIYNRVSSRKNSRKELLGYLQGSSTLLIEALVDAIQKKGGVCRLGVGVRKINFDSTGLASEIEDETGRRETAQAVVLAVQTPAASNILQNSSPLPAGVTKEFDVLKSVKYQQVISVIFFCKKSFSRYYWLNIADPQFPFPVIVEQTNLLGPENYKGHQLIYVSSYRDPDDKMYLKSDEEIVEIFLSGMRKMNPAWDRSGVEAFIVNRERFATPVYEKNFERLITPIQSNCRNLFYLNGTQVFPDSRNVNKMASLGKICLQKIESLALATIPSLD